MRPDPKAAAFFTDWVDRLWDLIEMRNNFEKPEHKQRIRDIIMRARRFYSIF